MAQVISAGQLTELAAGWIGVQQPAYVTTRLDYLPPMEVYPGTVWATQPSVRKVVDFIARAIASTPLHLYQRVSDTDRQLVTDHPITRVLAEPSEMVTPFRFWHSLVVDWLVFDKWFAIKAPTYEDDKPLDLVRLQAERLIFTDDGLGRVHGVKVDGGAQVLEDPTKWLFDHGYSPLGADGITPMATLQQVLSEATEAVDYRRSLWRNGARVAAVIQRPLDAPRWSDTARDRFVAGWREYAAGGSRVGGAPILEDGMTVATVDAFAPRQTQDLEGRQLNDVEVCSAYHIAPELVGARPGNYSNVAAFREMLYGPTLGPYYAALEQAVNTLLVDELDDMDGQLYVEWDVQSKMRGTFEQQAAVLSTSVGAPYLTRAEARARLNLPELPGTDELITPLNVLVGGQASPRDTGSQNEAINNPPGPAALAAATLAQFVKRAQRVVDRTGHYDEKRWRRELTDDLGPLLAEQAPVVAGAVTDGLRDQLDGASPAAAAEVFERWHRFALEGSRSC